ncbi:hypothetical protein FACS1894217_09270 [Clostridia bacterium]|nr:hypothetical protein FACS1894217_09270 [Clostridia bacterium]
MRRILGIIVGSIVVAVGVWMMIPNDTVVMREVDVPEEAPAMTVQIILKNAKEYVQIRDMKPKSLQNSLNEKLKAFATMYSGRVSVEFSDNGRYLVERFGEDRLTLDLETGESLE